MKKNVREFLNAEIVRTCFNSFALVFEEEKKERKNVQIIQYSGVDSCVVETQEKVDLSMPMLSVMFFVEIIGLTVVHESCSALQLQLNTASNYNFY